ncbi:hypothetical protein CHU98_g9513 [Xylaria longipes]|nr:hypothetical protein CHU98_g9513 [Xylaria longipes]
MEFHLSVPAVIATVILGPIIRVTPEELSINDPEFYNELYVTESKRRTNNYDIFCKGIDFDGSHLLTTDHDLHRRRRKPLEPFFSRKGITRLQAMLAEVAHNLESRLRELNGQSKVIRLDHALSAFSGDIIGRICLGGFESGNEFLDDPDFSPDWYTVIHTIVRSIPLFTAFPMLVKLLSYFPESILIWAYPEGRVFDIFSQKAKSHIRKAISQSDRIDESSLSIFHHIMNSDMPESERSEERLAKEAQVLLGGGTASTARTIVFASYYILSRPYIRSRLEEELREVMAAWPDRVPTWAELERVSFLQAIIKESLRYGVMHRLPRVSPDVPIRYKEYDIPVSYIPLRMSSAQKDGLAMAEMSLALAVLYRPGGPAMELYETDGSDVKQAHDFLIPLPKLTTKGVRVLIR